MIAFLANCTSPKMRASSLHGLEVMILLRDVTKVTGVHFEDVAKSSTGDVDIDVVNPTEAGYCRTLSIVSEPTN